MRTCICVSYSGDSHSAESHQGLQRNYCRNPDSDKHGAWCYTDPNTQLVWDYCRVKHCECFWRSSIGARFAQYSRFRPLFFVRIPANFFRNYLFTFAMNCPHQHPVHFFMPVWSVPFKGAGRCFSPSTFFFKSASACCFSAALRCSAFVPPARCFTSFLRQV